MNTPHCSQCGTAMTQATVAGREREQCPACGWVAYRNPAPVGMAVIAHEGQWVLIRRGADPLANYWAPPAGYVECGESVPDAAKREAREECGLDVELEELIGVYSQADVDVLIIAYRAHSIGGQLRAGDDAIEVGLFQTGRFPIQEFPTAGTAVDRWLHGVIQDVTRHACQT